MNHTERVPAYTYTFDAIDPSMPGTFMVHTERGTRYAILHGPGGEALICRLPSSQDLSRRPLDSRGSDVDEGRWVAVSYDDVRVGMRIELFSTEERPGGGRGRIFGATGRVTLIGLYEGVPDLPELNETMQLFDAADLAAQINKTQSDTIRRLKDR